jgi:signal peptidase I
MMKYRLYVIAVFYIIAVVVSLTIYSARGIYLHPNTNKSMPMLIDDKFYFYGKEHKTIDKLTYGDIVLYFAPDTPEELVPGRIVAMPGDRLEIKQGTFFLGGEEKEFNFGTSEKVENKSSLPEITIPRNMLYVIPDNQAAVNYNDKRYFLHISQVKGKFLKSYFKAESF